jgi:CRISPR-associated endonuclease/helicase Cas3
MALHRLLAKRSDTPDAPREAETLPGHLRAVVETARALVDLQGERYLETFALRPCYQRESLAAAVTRGAFLHDLGKANHQFQRMVRLGGRIPQALRHEWISAWLVVEIPALDRWVFAGVPEAERQAALCAALGHHLKTDSGDALVARDGSGDTTVRVLTGHLDVRASLAVARETLGLLAPPPNLVDLEIDLVDRPLEGLRAWLVDAWHWHEQADAPTRRFVALVKALVVAADVVGSAVPRFGGDPVAWAREALQRRCSAGELSDIALTRLRGCPARPFQTAVAAGDGAVTFVRAGCGTGKTVAAYLWAARHAAGRKLFVCYPTTGTATEGFRDYVVPTELGSEAALLHSRSELDLETIRETREEDPLESAARVEALAAWDVPLVVCTTDQVLALVQNGRRALFSFPALTDAAFVFDEIHQYDDRLFGALLRFLGAFLGVPILLMTASLPRPRLAALEASLGTAGRLLRVVEGPVDLERILRYLLRGPETDPPWEVVARTLSEGGRVLWVANTVERARQLAEVARERGLAAAIPYHSRYRYGDRIRRHNAVMDAFREAHHRPVLAVTTQVCEVSLDLSADLLVTDLAPVPALIQRLGRLNRRVTAEEPGRPRLAVVIEPPRPEPYEKEELEVARDWLRLLGPEGRSQADLGEAFEAIARDVPVRPVWSAWLDGGPFSGPAPLREADATVLVVRSEDASACVDAAGRPIAREVVRYGIPMLLGPVAKEIPAWRRMRMAFVAPPGRIEYSDEWGARWTR